MNKEEYIARYGEVSYEKMRNNVRLWTKRHPKEVVTSKRKYYDGNKEEVKIRSKKYREAHQKEVKVTKRKWRIENRKTVIASNRERCRKGGKYYSETRIKKHTGLQGLRNKIRSRDWYDFHELEDNLAVKVVIHHEWIPETADYRGVGLVDAGQHAFGFVDVIQLLDGEITEFEERGIV